MSIYQDAIIAGFGGQGVMLIGNLLAYAGMEHGLNVTYIPVYGPEMRGGTANCSVVISDEPIGSPVINDADVLIAMNGPSLDKFVRQVKPGGLIIVDSALVLNRPGRDDIRFFPIPASSLASDLGNMNFAAIILLGCLAVQAGCFSRESFEKALADALPKRHHHLIPAEMQAFDQGGTFAEAK